MFKPNIKPSSIIFTMPSSSVLKCIVSKCLLQCLVSNIFNKKSKINLKEYKI